MTLEYFSYETDPMLACPCCGEQGMNESFMIKLDDMRAALGVPFVINSGYRCPSYNLEVSSTGRNGPHTTGRAVDISARGRNKYLIAGRAMAEGMTRFGMGRTFIHIDDLGAPEGFDERVIWTYST